MAPTLLDRVTPTAVGLVSRAWVLREVAAVPDLSAARRAEIVDQLCSYQPPRKHGLRDNFIAWMVMLGGAMVFNWLGLPGWLGFLLGLAGLVAVARVLMLRVLRWRLAQLLGGDRNAAVDDEPR
jgi:Flp pilus assembly protein TadB